MSSKKGAKEWSMIRHLQMKQLVNDHLRAETRRLFEQLAIEAQAAYR